MVTLIRVALAASVVVAAVTVAVVPIAREAPPSTFPAPHEDKTWPLASGHQQEQRDAALRRATVWTSTDPVAADFKSNPPDPSGLLSEPVVRCRYRPDAPHGTTPKFECVLRNGEVVKVKYGWATAEVHAEVAASHLLAALGFGADQMFFLPRLRCFGCPRFPFEATEVLERLGAREAVVRRLPEDRYVDFEWVAAERRFPGHEIAAGDQKGWAWWELDRVDPSAGASRAELDALRLMARFLAHWDNKASNQRLVCLSPIGEGETMCPRPFAFIHDLGATFGPDKVLLPQWEATRIWADAKQCRVSMKDMPYKGGTFPDADISEDGRALALHQLGALSETQITDLFEAAHFGTFRGWHLRARPVSEWVRVFRAKVDEIRGGGPCPDRPSHLSH